MTTYPMLCTGCEAYVYEGPESEPCQNCFPGLTHRAVLAKIDRLIDEVIAERDAGTWQPLSEEDKAILRGITDDFFAFEAAACTGRPGCGCGRAPDHPAHRP